MTKTSSPDFSQKIDKIWKTLVALAGIIGMLSGALSWAFTFAMTDRDRDAREIRGSVESLESEITALRDRVLEADRMARSAELRAAEDMNDIRIVLSVIQARLDYTGRVMEAERSRPSSISGGTRTLGSSRMPDLVPLNEALGRISSRHPVEMSTETSPGETP